MHTLAARGPGIAAGQLRRDAAFVEEDEIFGRDTAELLEELLAAEPVGFGVALGGMERLY